LKILFLTVSSSLPSWLEGLSENYKKKLSYWLQPEFKTLKSPSFSRLADKAKVSSESELLLKNISSQDFVILCDEHGASFTSEKFSARLEKILESGKKRIVVIVGGAYGVNSDVKTRADLTLRLSEFLLNHYLALAVVQEQVYRAMTIIKGVSYHNAAEAK
jgi:23S rRNA (pseudouridine1915-N3)-methyltransferase